MKNKIVEHLKKLKEKQEISYKSAINYMLQVEDQVYHSVFIKSTKVLLIGSHLFVLYCQLWQPLLINSKCFVPLLEPLTHLVQVPQWPYDFAPGI